MSDVLTDDELDAHRAALAGNLAINLHAVVPVMVRMLATIDHYKALASPTAREGWRPIEEAPKDGTKVDLWHAQYGRLVNCKWDAPLSRWVAIGEPDDNDANEYAFGGDVTHFMPLPAPPSPDGGGRD